MISTNEKLRAAAAQALQSTKGDVSKAAAAFARDLASNTKRPLLIALATDYLSRLPDAPPQPIPPKRREANSRSRVGPHRRPALLPTPEQRAGAIKAGNLIQHAIFDRRVRGAGKLGDIHVHELRAIAETQAATATSFLQRGYEDAVESIWCLMLNDHVTNAEPFTKVRDAIQPKVAEAALAQAKIKAAEVMRDGASKVANDLIASAREVEHAS